MSAIKAYLEDKYSEAEELTKEGLTWEASKFEVFLSMIRDGAMLNTDKDRRDVGELFDAMRSV